MSHQRELLLWGASGAVIAVLYQSGWLFTTISWLSVIIFGAAGFFLGAAIVLNSGKRYETRSRGNEGKLANMLIMKLMVHPLKWGIFSN